MIVFAVSQILGLFISIYLKIDKVSVLYDKLQEIVDQGTFLTFNTLTPA